MLTEDYTRARTLAKFTVHGTEMRVVRRRLSGKPWRKYLELLGPGNVVCASNSTIEGCPKAAAAEWHGRVLKYYEESTGRAAFLSRLQALADGTAFNAQVQP